MATLLLTLHVLAAVLLVGPLVVAPFVARRAIARRSSDGVRAAANQLSVFGAGSLATAGLGVLALVNSKLYDFSTPWVIISSTLYVIMLGLVYLYGVPALRKAARMVSDGVLPRAEPVEHEEAEVTTLTATAADLRTKERLDAISGRVTLSGLLILLAAAAIVVMMTAKPF